MLCCLSVLKMSVAVATSISSTSGTRPTVTMDSSLQKNHDPEHGWGSRPRSIAVTEPATRPTLKVRWASSRGNYRGPNDGEQNQFAGPRRRVQMLLPPYNPLLSLLAQIYQWLVSLFAGLF